VATHTFATKSGAIALADLDAALLEAAKSLPYYPFSINTQTGTPYVLVLADATPNKIVRMTVAGANQVTLPTTAGAAIPIGSRIPIDQWGGGQTTIAGDGGVTLRATPTAKTRAQYSRVWVQKIAAEEWLLEGDLASS